jgi:hypothetical protein
MALANAIMIGLTLSLDILLIVEAHHSIRALKTDSGRDLGSS